MRELLQILSLLFLMSTKVFPQSVDLYLIKENVETVITSNKLIVSDPMVYDNYVNLPSVLEFTDILKKGKDNKADEPHDVKTPFVNLGMKLESSLNQTCKKVCLPLGLSIGNVRLSMSIPYYLERSMEYSHGFENTSGLGDMLLGLNYRLSNKKLITEFKVNTKLATGNENKLVNGYLVPLGTGNTDFLIGNFMFLNGNHYNFYTNICYNISGTHTRLVEIYYPEIDGNELIEYGITNGNTLLFNSVLGIKLGHGFALMAGIGGLSHSEGKKSEKHTYSWDKPSIESKNESANQDFIHVDLNTGIAYTLLKFDFILNYRPPLYTKRNDNNIEDVRKALICFKVSRKIF